VFKTLDIDYLAMNCASSSRGLHEAVINHGGNTKPEIITCPHEEIAVHMAQGYPKIEGKPMAMICQGSCVAPTRKTRPQPDRRLAD
jgi:acetolactate synthase I/II/III large subunit